MIKLGHALVFEAKSPSSPAPAPNHRFTREAERTQRSVEDFSSLNFPSPKESLCRSVLSVSLW